VTRAILLTAALLSVWASGVNTATNHWLDAASNLLFAAIFLGARYIALSARSDDANARD
jgi:TRAP-type mannitol/chloroaromatic compound transport system permease small subunit